MNEWDRQPGESSRDFSRFDLYRLLGPGRSVDAAFRVEAEEREGKRAGAGWRRAADKWNWQRRAEAWDTAETAKLRAEEEERRRLARETRIKLLQDARDRSWKAIQTADLDKLSKEEARQMLSGLRLLLFEALKGERLELGEPTEIVAGEDVVHFRADELAKAEDDLREWRDRRKELSG